MELLSISTSDKKKSSAGFTLIEILLVMAIFGTVLGLGLIMGFDSYRRDSLKTERNTLISVLHKTRSQAINNINNIDHGFYFNGTNYIIFEGTSSASRIQSKDLIVEKNPTITFSGLSEVVFGQLTGDVTLVGNMTLSDGLSSSTLDINQEGMINW